MSDKHNEGKNSIVSRELNPVDQIFNRKPETAVETLGEKSSKTLDFVEKPKEEVKETPIVRKEVGSIQNKPVGEVDKPKQSITKVGEEAPKEGEGDIKKQEIEVKAKFKGNPIAVYANYYREQGKLPSDFEVADDITLEQFEEAVGKQREDHYVSLAKSEFYKEQEEAGITESVWDTAKRLSGGVSEEEVTELMVLRELSQITLDPESEAYQEQAKEYLSYYYSLFNLPDSKIIQNVNADLADTENLATNLEAARGKFEEQVETKDKAQKATMLAAEQAKETRRLERINKEKSIISSLNIDGLSISKEQADTFMRDYFENNEVYEYEDGRKIRVSAYTKRVLEDRKNPERRLRYKVEYVLGLDSINAAEQAKRTTVGSLVSQMNKLIETDAKFVEKTDKSGNKTQLAESGIVRTEIKS